jgi:hypothetical protein
MPTSLKTAAESYLRAKALSRGTRNEYLSTLRKWETWGGGIPIETSRAAFGDALAGRELWFDGDRRRPVFGFTFLGGDVGQRP